MGFEGNGYYECRWKLGSDQSSSIHLEETYINGPNHKKIKTGILCYAYECERTSCRYHFIYQDWCGELPKNLESPKREDLIFKETPK